MPRVVGPTSRTESGSGMSDEQQVSCQSSVEWIGGDGEVGQGESSAGISIGLSKEEEDPKGQEP